MAKAKTTVTTTQRSLIKAADELTEVMGLEPAIDTAQNAEVLKDMIREAASKLEENDELSPDTTRVLKELGCLASKPEEPEKKSVEPEKKSVEKQVVEQAEGASKPRKTGQEKKKATASKTSLRAQGTSSAARIESILHKKKACTVQELAKEAGCKPSRVSSHLSTLVREGVIVVERKDKGPAKYKLQSAANGRTN